MVKTLIILILLFDGNLIQEKYGDEHREAIATYREFNDAFKNGWYLNDGRGTIQGYICK